MGRTLITCLLGPALTCLAGVPAAAQKPIDWPALTQKPYGDKAAPDLGLRPLLERGGKPITTKDDWQAQRQALEQAWRDRLGPMPQRPKSLESRVEQSKECDGYTRQLLSFASEGEDRIRAYLLIPDGLREEERRPAVVVFHQTTRETLNEPVGLDKKNPELALALQLVKRGYITLSPECYILKDPDNERKDGNNIAWAHHRANVLNKRHPDWTGMGKMTFDASRCIDFLESLPNVDAKRIGCIGHSLGAKEVLFALAFEPRYQVGVFNEGGIGLRMSNWTDPWYLTEKMKDHIPAQENHQVLALCAPRPILILGGGSADGDASWPFVQAALPVYRLLGAGDQTGLVNHLGGHSFPRAARQTAYRWLDFWLRHTPATEEVGP